MVEPGLKEEILDTKMKIPSVQKEYDINLFFQNYIILCAELINVFRTKTLSNLTYFNQPVNFYQHNLFTRNTGYNFRTLLLFI